MVASAMAPRKRGRPSGSAGGGPLLLGRQTPEKRSKLVFHALDVAVVSAPPEPEPPMIRLPSTVPLVAERLLTDGATMVPCQVMLRA